MYQMLSIFVKKPLFTLTFFTIILLFAVISLSPSSPFSQIPLYSYSAESDIWSAKRILEWRPCKWWLQGHLTALPAESNGFIQVDCYGGLNQMRRDLCDGVGVARLLNGTLVLPKFEVAAYWNESSGFTDVFDVDYFIQQLNGFIKVVKELPAEIASKEPVRVDCSKRKGHFDYVESVLPSLLEHRYISITPAMSQRRDRFPLYAKTVGKGHSFSQSRSFCLKQQSSWKSCIALAGCDEFFDKSHLQYYDNNSGSRISIKEKEMKKQLKLVKGLSKNLAIFSDMGFGLNLDNGLDQQVRGKMISEATEVLVEQLKKLKAEKMELKKRKKEEKAKKKAAKMMDCKCKDSSSSSSSESECEKLASSNVSQLLASSNVIGHGETTSSLSC